MTLFFRSSLFLLLAFFSVGAFAQKAYVRLEDAPSKLVKKYKKTESISIQLDAESKKSKLQSLLSNEPILLEALVDMAKVYYYEKDYDRAIQFIDEAVSNTPQKVPEWHNIYAGICKAKEDYACEKTNLLAYTDTDQISFKKRRKAELRLGKLEEIEMIIANTEPVAMQKLSYHINSDEFAEYKPVLSTNDSTIVFTRRVNGQEDFYVSHLTKEGWTEATPLAELNTEGNEGAHAISPDGKYMIFTRCDVPNRYRSCDLYISKFKDTKWGEPKYMGVANTEAWESQAAFSPDGKTVYFSSGREGGIGNKDLYYIQHDGKKWGEAINLGEVINTKGNEESPYIHPDGRTLYFMSTGHPGLGGYDLFVSKKRPDETWTKPINMGPAINSSQDEGGLFVDLKGEYAYYSKTELQNEDLKSDIYRFPLPLKFKPDPVSYIELHVMDGKTGEKLDAKLIMKEKTYGHIRTLNIPKTGLTEIIYPNTLYEITVEKEHYVFYSDNINPAYRSDQKKPIVYTVELFPIPSEVQPTDQVEIVLKNIYFETGKARLLADSYDELNRLISLLQKEANTKIIIFGHTDNIGNEQDNLLLSQNRADAVKNYLIKNTIEAGRIQTKALGESQPIASNDTEEGRAQNRRISFSLQK